MSRFQSVRNALYATLTAAVLAAPAVQAGETEELGQAINDTMAAVPAIAVEAFAGAFAATTADSQEGEDYWDALQLAREWTKQNHLMLHTAIARSMGNKIEDQFWNEHNFVFRKSDGLFYHAKGATPSYSGFSPDDDGRIRRRHHSALCRGISD